MEENYLSVSSSGNLSDFENNALLSGSLSVEGIIPNTDTNLSRFTEERVAFQKEISNLFLAHLQTGERDDRIPVDTDKIPYRFICQLVIFDGNGKQYIGTGFFISPRCVITSGHCVYNKDLGGWLSSIKVIPGKDANEEHYGWQESSNFRSVVGWTEKQDKDFDIGAIILPDDMLFNKIGGYFGYMELGGPFRLNISGYPTRKAPKGKQWTDSSDVYTKTDYKILYDIDTTLGQSGSPMFVAGNQGQYYVVGVHGEGGLLNGGIRVRDYIFQRWAEWSSL